MSQPSTPSVVTWKTPSGSSVRSCRGTQTTVAPRSRQQAPVWILCHTIVSKNMSRIAKGEGQTLVFARRASPRGLGGHPLDQTARLRDVRDFEITGHDRPVIEQPSEQTLLDLDRTDACQPHRRSAPSQRPVDDEELLRG